MPGLVSNVASVSLYFGTVAALALAVCLYLRATSRHHHG